MDNDHNRSNVTGQANSAENRSAREMAALVRDFMATERANEKQAEQSIDAWRSNEHAQASDLTAASLAQQEQAKYAASLVKGADRGSAEARAEQLVQRLDKALVSLNSSQLALQLQARLGAEAYVHHGTTPPQSLHFITEIPKQAVIAANQNIREFLRNCEKNSGVVSPATFVSKSAFSVTPEGRATVYAHAGASGDIQAILNGNRGIVDLHYETKAGSSLVKWTATLAGNLKAEGSLTSRGATMDLQLQDSRDAQTQTTAKDTEHTASNARGSASLEAFVTGQTEVTKTDQTENPVQRSAEKNATDKGLLGELGGSLEHSTHRTQEKANITTETSPGARIGLQVELQFTVPPEPKREIEVFNGSKRSHWSPK